MKKLQTMAVITAALFFFCLITFPGCSGRNIRPEKEHVIYVKTKIATESDNLNLVSYSGVVEEKSSIALSFSSFGTVESILVSEGDYVTKGQLVARLNPTSAQNMFNAAESSLKQAQDAYDRLKSIHEKGSLPDVQMVDIETKLNQAKSTFNIAEKNLGDCSLYAPVSGVVGKRLAEAGENAIIGKPVMTLMDISLVKVRFSVPENEISRIPSSCESVITVSALGDKQFHGKRVDKNVIANPLSRAYSASVTVPNPGRELLPGMVCKIELRTGSRETGIVIPLEVVMISSDSRRFVWCNDNGIARRRFIETGDIRGNGVEVKQGISAGDIIITEGMYKISEGDKINVR